MIALAALIVVLAPLPQDEGRLKEAWPGLVEAWKSLDAHKAADSDPMSDDNLRLLGKVHKAFEAAGFMESAPGFGSGSLKQFIRLRGEKALGGASNSSSRRFHAVEGGGGVILEWHEGGELGVRRKSDGAPLDKLLASLAKLGELKDKGVDDDDNIQDELAAARKSFKDLSLTTDDTPLWLRRRLLKTAHALVLGQAYPEMAGATEEQAAQIKGWIADLGHETLETRDKASRELCKWGEQAHPLLVEASKATDPEVAARAQKILGVGHNPWKDAAARKPQVSSSRAVFELAEPVPVPVEPAEPKKDE